MRRWKKCVAIDKFLLFLVSSIAIVNRRRCLGSFTELIQAEVRLKPLVIRIAYASNWNGMMRHKDRQKKKKQNAVKNDYANNSIITKIVNYSYSTRR